jgi:hypothetical protein
MAVAVADADGAYVCICEQRCRESKVREEKELARRTHLTIADGL